MGYNSNIHHRRSIRLKGYDYSQAGAYFITICINESLNILSKISDKKILYTPFGHLTQNIWNELPNHYTGVAPDALIVMPNHIHGIIWLTDNNTDNMTLSDVIHRFKSFTTNKYIDGVKNLGWPEFNRRVWQRNYYEKIIRNENALNQIREYIVNNPIAWESKINHIEKYHPQPDL